MLRELSCRQYLDWQIIYGIEPWGEWRSDLRMGILASAVIAPHAKKGKEPEPKDFMPDFTESKKAKQTPEQQAQIFQRVAAPWGKVVVKKGGK